MSDDYQSIKVAAARAAVQESGKLEGIEGPLFLAEAGAEWEPFFSKELYGATAHPEFAKVTVTRVGQKPREVVIAWDEYAEQMDSDPEWDAIRAQKPMAVFGSEAERHAYRVVFADVLAAAFPLDTIPTQTYGQATPSVAHSCTRQAGRDWRSEIAAADAGALDALLDEARAAGAIAADPDLQGAFMDRLLQLEQKPKPSPAQVPAKPQRSQGQGRRRGKR